MFLCEHSLHCTTNSFHTFHIMHFGTIVLQRFFLHLWILRILLFTMVVHMDNFSVSCPFKVVELGGTRDGGLPFVDLLIAKRPHQRRDCLAKSHLKYNTVSTLWELPYFGVCRHCVRTPFNSCMHIHKLIQTKPKQRETLVKTLLYICHGYMVNSLWN